MLRPGCADGRPKIAADERAPMTTAATEASLRRIATLVAKGAAPETVLEAVTKEVLRRFGSGTARMIRYELDGTATILADEGTFGPHVNGVKRGRTIPNRPNRDHPTHRRTRRVDDYRDIPGADCTAASGCPSMSTVDSGRSPSDPRRVR